MIFINLVPALTALGGALSGVVTGVNTLLGGISLGLTAVLHL
jgi:hypothetical protein